MREGQTPLVPEGSVGAFDRYEQFDALTEAEQDHMRAVILDHDNDPIAAMPPALCEAAAVARARDPGPGACPRR